MPSLSRWENPFSITIEITNRDLTCSGGNTWRSGKTFFHFRCHHARIHKSSFMTDQNFAKGIVIKIGNG